MKTPLNGSHHDNEGPFRSQGPSFSSNEQQSSTRQGLSALETANPSTRSTLLQRPPGLGGSQVGHQNSSSGQKRGRDEASIGEANTKPRTSSPEQEDILRTLLNQLIQQSRTPSQGQPSRPAETGLHNGFSYQGHQVQQSSIPRQAPGRELAMILPLLQQIFPNGIPNNVLQALLVSNTNVQPAPAPQPIIRSTQATIPLPRYQPPAPPPAPQDILSQWIMSTLVAATMQQQAQQVQVQPQRNNPAVASLQAVANESSRDQAALVALVSHLLGTGSRSQVAQLPAPVAPPSIVPQVPQQQLQQSIPPHLASASIKSSVSGGSQADGMGRAAYDLTSSYSTPSPPPEPSSGISLALGCDSEQLSQYQMLVRKQLEIFEAQQSDVESNTQGRKKRVKLGQVGLRCRHCAHTPRRQRGRGAIYYPTKLSGVYQAAQNMASSHLCEACHMIPVSLKAELRRLRDEKSTPSSMSSTGKQYWADGVKVLGVYETEDGLMMNKSTVDV